MKKSLPEFIPFKETGIRFIFHKCKLRQDHIVKWQVFTPNPTDYTTSIFRDKIFINNRCTENNIPNQCIFQIAKQTQTREFKAIARTYFSEDLYKEIKKHFKLFSVKKDVTGKNHRRHANIHVSKCKALNILICQILSEEKYTKIIYRN